MFEYLREFQGIIGAISGVVVTLITTEIIRRFGKIDIHLSKKKLEFLKQTPNEIGIVNEEIANNLSEADIFSYCFDLAFYNSSDISKSFFDVCFRFVDADSNDYEDIPYNKDKSRHSGHSWIHEEIDTIELEPKRLKLIKLNGWIRRDQLIKHTNSIIIKEVYFVARNEKNKKFIRRIY